MATTISVDEETRDQLKKLGEKGETYDDILRELIKKHFEAGETESKENESGKGAEGYRKRAERSRKLEEEMNSVSTEANKHLG